MKKVTGKIEKAEPSLEIVRLAKLRFYLLSEMKEMFHNVHLHITNREEFIAK